MGSRVHRGWVLGPQEDARTYDKKKSNFYSDVFWLSKYVCIKKCDLILCIYIFGYTWGCIKSKRGVPETSKIKLWFKGFGPPFVFETCRTSIHLLVSKTNKEKNQRIKLLKHSCNSKSRTQKKTLKFKTRCHVNWFTDINLRPINLQQITVK